MPFRDPEPIFIESGGVGLAATVSSELSNLTFCVIDVAGGEMIPRKLGPGITRSSHPNSNSKASMPSGQ